MREHMPPLPQMKQGAPNTVSDSYTTSIQAAYRPPHKLSTLLRIQRMSYAPAVHVILKADSILHSIQLEVLDGNMNADAGGATFMIAEQFRILYRNQRHPNKTT